MSIINSEKHWIAKFTEKSGTVPALVGGKGANLGLLAQQGFPVPAGFCITTESYTTFLQLNHLEGFLAGQMDQLEAGAPPSEIYKAIKTKFEDAPIPKAITGEITNALDDLGNNDAFAVRSSATSEDLPENSFAGQLETYLNIRGHTQILAATKKCWASLFTDRVIAYRKTNHIGHRGLKIAVVVQRQIQSEKSGIMFTADPLSGNRAQLTIDAGFGLGEALVSGRVSADYFKVDKREAAILERKIATKKIGVFSVDSSEAGETGEKGGGVREQSLPEDLQVTPSLSDAECLALAQIGQQIEDYYGQPQDIEWAIEGPHIYVTQARPITTLYPLPADMEGGSHLFISFNYVQVMMDPILPLGISGIQMMVNSNPRERLDSHSIAHHAGGRIFLDVASLLAIKAIGKKMPAGLANIVDPSLGRALQKGIEITTPHIHATLKNKATVVKAMSRVVPIALRGLSTILFRNPEKAFERGVAYLDSVVEECRAELTHDQDPLKLLFTIEKWLHQMLITKIVPTGSNIIAAIVAQNKLKQILTDSGLSEEFISITRGIEGNITTEMDLEVGNLTDELIASGPGVIAETKNHRPEAPNPGRFQQKLDHFMKKFGMRGPGEIDITKERYAENPEALQKMIQANLSTKTRGDHLTRHHAYIDKAQNAIEKVKQNFSGRKQRRVNRLIRVFRACMPFREYPKYTIIRLFWLIKQKYLELGTLLEDQGWIHAQKDLYYLRLPEIQQILECPPERIAEESLQFKNLVQTRKQDYAKYAKMRSPKIMTETGEIVTGDLQLANLAEGMLRGVGVSSGEITGVAHVIFDPYHESLQKGEILVTTFTDPGWTPLFINAAGLVMEVGGIMTHGSVVAREYGIPAIAGVDGATDKIKTGQLIRINGDAGVVEIIEDGPARVEKADTSGL